MIPVSQTIFHPLRQDDYEACLASILNLDLEDLRDLTLLRHEMEEASEVGDVGNLPQRLIEYDSILVMKYGHHSVRVSAVSRFQCFIGVKPRGLSVASGSSESSPLHHCVAMDGAVVHDPNPEGNGLLEILEYTLLIPVLSEIHEG